MTTSRQKAEELFFVEEAARKLGVAWRIEPRESPDFFVTSGAHCFGLEVAQAYIGPSTRKGSRARAAEGERERWLAGLRREYEARANTPLDLKFLGMPSDAAYSAVLGELIREDFPTKPLAHRIEREIETGKIWATKAFRPTWILMKDSVGWVSRDARILQTTIDKKAKQLIEYQEVCRDIRLLVVANRRRNSGKLALDEDATPNLRGFDTVYFLSHPSEIKVYGKVSREQ